MARRKRRKGPFDDLQNAAVGLGGLGISTAVGAGIGARAPAGSPSVTQGFSTLASFTPIVATSVGGGAALKAVRKLKRKKKKSRYY